MGRTPENPFNISIGSRADNFSEKINQREMFAAETSLASFDPSMIPFVCIAHILHMPV